MKRLLLSAILLATLTTLAVAQPQVGIDALNRAVTTFLQSNQLLTRDSRWSNNQLQYHFKCTVEGDTIGEPQALKDLIRAFTVNVVNSSSCYFHKAEDGPVPFRGVSIRRKDSFHSHIYGMSQFEDDYNFIILHFKVNGKMTLFNLKWRQLTFADRNNKPFSTIDGVLSKYWDVWEILPFLAADEPASHDYQATLNSTEVFEYEKLVEQVKFLSIQLVSARNKGDDPQCDVMAYTLQKLFDSYDSHLTMLQYMNIREGLDSILQTEQNVHRKRIVETALLHLSLRVEPSNSGRITSFKAGTNNPFADKDNDRLFRLSYDFGAKGQHQVQVNWQGQSRRPVHIMPTYFMRREISISPTNGRFTFANRFDANQLLSITDRKGHSLVLFADSVATTIDLEQGLVHGSPLNQRLADCQRRLRLLEHEQKRYRCTFPGEALVMDSAGYQQLCADVLQMVCQMVEENRDNLVPVWLLSTYGYDLSLEQLKPLMQRNRPYADHVAIQPIWAHYEGLLKRQPGQAFTDVACRDTANQVRRLGELVGQGRYAVVHFWSSHSMVSRKGCKGMKRLYRLYGNQANIVGLAIDEDHKTWKRYIKSRGLHFPHLMVDHPEKQDLWDTDAVKAYGLTYLPETLVFDPQGRIVGNYRTIEEATAAIAKLLE